MTHIHQECIGKWTIDELPRIFEAFDVKESDAMRNEELKVSKNL